MGNNVNSATRKTFENVEYRVGVVGINLDITAAKTAAEVRTIVSAAKATPLAGTRILGVSRGGIQITVATEWMEMVYDDSDGPFVGSSEKGPSTVQFTLTILEATPENTKLAMGTADIDDVEGVEVVQERDYIDILKDYIDHMYVVTRQGKAGITVIEFDNVLSIGGYNEKKNDKGQTEIALTLQATRGDLESEGEAPYRKVFFPVIAAPIV